MRAIIWNAHWATLGGGEVYAARLAQVCQKEGFEVVMVGVHDSPLSDLESRLGLVMTGYKYIKLKSESDLKQIVRKNDLFINASFGSELAALAENSIYVCHFPTRNLSQKILDLLENFQTTSIVDENFNLIQFHAGLGLLVGSGSIKVKRPQNLNIICSSGTVEILLSNDKSHVLEEGSELSIACPRGTLGVKSRGGMISVLRISRERKSTSLIELFLHSKSGIPNFAQSYTEVWANSLFTRMHIQDRWNVQSEVVYPPSVFSDSSESIRNPYQIVSVGRFMSPKRGHSKNQIELIEAFNELVTLSNQPWELNLIGGLDQSNQDYFDKVQKEVVRSPGQVRLFPNCDSTTKHKVVSKSTFFWHAGGLGIPENQPEKMEHFGIAVVEAMNSGLIPIVFNAAGPAEILVNHPSLVFESLSELAAGTLEFSRQEDEVKANLRKVLINESQKYSNESFHTNVANQIKKFKDH
jgi:glycosyltransferase involved in cell wall biosynthesis